MYQYFKRQLKTQTCFGSFGIHPQEVLVILELYLTNLTFHFILQSKFHAAKHRLRTQNITSNLSEARLIRREDGFKRIRNMSEFFSVL